MESRQLTAQQPLVGISDIALMTGVTRAAVVNWRARSDTFPRPVSEGRAGPVFDREHIVRWLETNRPAKAGIKPLGFETKLWQAADLLRNNLDPAEYKHVVLGLIFLKYISDSFQDRREAVEAATHESNSEYYCGTDDQRVALLEDRDIYTALNVFWVPHDSRWSYLRDNAKQPSIGKLIDGAMVALERDNPRLKGVLPKDYARPALDWHIVGQLIDLISGIGLGPDTSAPANDVLGRVYEYFLARFASTEGKGGGEFYTPAPVVRLLVQMIEPYSGRVFDPCCGSGGMFVQSVKFIEAHGGRRDQLSVYGQESNPTTWRLCQMNLAIRGIEANLGPEPADSFRRDLHPDLKADYVLANPPFNISDWRGELLRDDARWKYGVPSVANANYAWVQHFVHHLSPRGRAGFVLANGALTSKTGGEDEIRQALVEADLIDCVVALPNKLFYTRQLPVSLWFVARSKSSPGERDHRGETLFIDARSIGELTDRTHRDLSEEDINAIAGAYHRWRHGPYEDTPGFCTSVRTDAIRAKSYSLKPNLYVASVENTGLESPDARVVGIVRERASVARRMSDLSAELETALGILTSTIKQTVPTPDGDLPRGWHWARIGDLTTYVSRGIGPAYVDFDGVLVINQKCIRDGGLDLEKARRHDTKKRSIAGRELQIGDILVNSTGVGTLGRLAQVVAVSEPMIVDGHVTVVRPNPKLIDRDYFAAYLLSREAEIEELGEGTTGQTELSKQQVLDFPILVPPADVQSVIGAAARRSAELLEALQAERKLVVDLMFNVYSAVAVAQFGVVPEPTESGNAASR